MRSIINVEVMEAAKVVPAKSRYVPNSPSHSPSAVRSGADIVGLKLVGLGDRPGPGIAFDRASNAATPSTCMPA